VAQRHEGHFWGCVMHGRATQGSCIAQDGAFDGRTVGGAEAHPALCVFTVHYKTNSRVIRRVIRFGLVIEYPPGYRVNYQPDYRPGSAEVPAW